MAITLSKFISAKRKEARETAIQMLHTLGSDISDGDYTEISAVH